MALKDILRINRKTFIDPEGWIGANEIGAHTKYFASNIKSFAKVPEPQYEETFEEAIERFGLNDEHLTKIGNQYLAYSVVFVVIAALCFIASFIFIFEYFSIAGFILSIATMSVLLAQAFRFNFWHFQIKNRKLGCTLKEWWKGSVSSSSEENK